MLPARYIILLYHLAVGFNNSLFSAASTAQSGLTGLGAGTGLFNQTPQNQAKGLFSGTTGGGMGISSAGAMPATSSLFQTPLQNCEFVFLSLYICSFHCVYMLLLL